MIPLWGIFVDIAQKSTIPLKNIQGHSKREYDPPKNLHGHGGRGYDPPWGIFS